MTPESPDPQALRTLAVEAARLGARIAREAFDRPRSVALKADRSEVTEVDLAAQRQIEQLLRTRRPDDAILGEETTGPQRQNVPDDAVWWLIDPIDGTRNFVRGIPIFACSVAAMHRGRVLAGAICDAMLDVTYSATAEGPVFTNDVPLASTEPATEHLPPTRRLLVAVPSLRRERTRPLVQLVLEKHLLRNSGSTALHLAWVALGRLDAAVSGNSRLWDIAAGAALLEAAGCVLSDPEGRAVLPIDPARYDGREIPTLAARPEAHRRLLDEVSGRPQA